MSYLSVVELISVNDSASNMRVGCWRLRGCYGFDLKLQYFLMKTVFVLCEN